MKRESFQISTYINEVSEVGETMKLLVKNISPEEGDDTYESWIYAQLESNPIRSI